MYKEQLALATATAGLLAVAYHEPALKILGTLGKLPLRLLNIRPNSVIGHYIEISGMRLSDTSRLRHTHILGATGTGKTLLTECLLFADLVRGRGAVIIDPKGDREFYDRVRSFCESIGRGNDLHFISANYPSESVRWNPCRLGSASEIQSKFLNSWEFSEIYYAKACETVLLEALNKLGNKSFNLADLVKALAKIESKDATALAMDLYNTINGEWGEILAAREGKNTIREISLLDIVRKNEILFVDLPTEGKSVQSTRIGKLLLQEIMLISGLRKIYPNLRSQTPFSIFVDEFDAFANQSFATFLNKGRSSGFMIHIAHQTLSDLKRVNENFLGQIQGNINNRFIFRIDDPEDAETLAKFFGTKKATSKTVRVSEGAETGDGSVRETDEFRIHPNTIKELNIGQCIFSSKTEKILKNVKLDLPDPKMYLKQFPINRATRTSKQNTDPVEEEYSPPIKTEEPILPIRNQ